ncbi:MAG: TAXI family TRAP transporter solute-binding subunit, partial [Desulfuromonas sp.]|nr:TAXI family TRAP transporter solute-binding subunit [Desulfuromonas sp.]
MSSRKFVAVLLAGLFATSILFNGGVAEAAKTRLAFSGGPDGGTFQYFANAISSRLSRMEKDIDISNMASAGSVENLRRVNSGDADFGIVYSGDLYLARIGQLTNDTRKYPNVLAMSYLYWAPAHLLVLSSSGINSVQDLTGKR